MYFSCKLVQGGLTSSKLPLQTSSYCRFPCLVLDIIIASSVEDGMRRAELRTLRRLSYMPTQHIVRSQYPPDDDNCDNCYNLLSSPAG
jgi:hypothetical protein